MLGPIGSWPSVNIVISTAMASNTETLTPIARSINQLRATWAHTAARTNVIMRARPGWRRTARPTHNPVR